MRQLTADSIGRWTQVAALLAVTAVVWGVLIPEDVFWAAIAAPVLMASALAAAVLVRSQPLENVGRSSMKGDE